MSTARKFLDNFEGYCCVLFLAVMSVVVFIQVVFRWIGASLPWTEELSRYLLVWTTFMGGAYGVKTRAHIGVEAFTLLMPKKVKRVLAIIVMVCGIILCGIIFNFGVQLTQLNFRIMQLTPAMRMPIAYMYLAIPIGMGCFILRYIINIYEAVRDFNKD